MSIKISKDTYKNVKICSNIYVKQRDGTTEGFHRVSGLNFGGTIMPVMCFCFLVFLDLPAPDWKSCQLFTRLWRDSSKFCCHSRSALTRSSSSISVSRFLLRSSWSRWSSFCRRLSMSANNFMTITYIACLYLAGSSSGMGSKDLPSFLSFLRFSAIYTVRRCIFLS